jgi:GDP-L-fucose synthase
LIRKFHEAKVSNAPTVTVWGTGTPRREFLYSDDMADACMFLMNLPDEEYQVQLRSEEMMCGKFEPPLVNIGTGTDITIRELAETIKRILGYSGEIVFDPTKPDGTPRKLMDVGRLKRTGWTSQRGLIFGLTKSCMDYQAGSLL